MKSINVRRVSVSSFGKLIGVWAALVGLVIGVMAAVVGVSSLLVNGHYSIIAGLLYSVGIVLFTVVVYPVILFALGWIQGAIVALIFNIVISGSGGLEMMVEEVKDAELAKK